MQILNLASLRSHDVFEFSYACNYDISSFSGSWNENSIYILDEDFSRISKYIDEVIIDFNYFGPNKVEVEKWNQVKQIFIESNLKSHDILNFFSTVDSWLCLDKNDFFWILGV